MRTTIDLNFDWTFKKQFSPEDLARPITEDYETVDLPHCYPTLPFNYPGEEYRGYVSLYKKEFFLTKTPRKNRQHRFRRRRPYGRRVS